MLLFGGKMKPVCDYDYDLNYILYQYRSLHKRKIKPFLSLMHNCREDRQKLLAQSSDNADLVTPLAVLSKEQTSGPHADRFYNAEEEQLEKNNPDHYLSVQGQNLFEGELSQMTKKYALFQVEQQCNLQSMGYQEKWQAYKLAADNKILVQFDEEKTLWKERQTHKAEFITNDLQRVDDKLNKQQCLKMVANNHGRAWSEERQKDINLFRNNYSEVKSTEVKSSSSKQNTAAQSNAKSKNNLNQPQTYSSDINYPQQFHKQLIQNENENIFNESLKKDEQERSLQFQIFQSSNENKGNIQIILQQNFKQTLKDKYIQHKYRCQLKEQKANNNEQKDQKFQSQLFTGYYQSKIFINNIQALNNELDQNLDKLEFMRYEQQKKGNAENSPTQLFQQNQAQNTQNQQKINNFEPISAEKYTNYQRSSQNNFQCYIPKRHLRQSQQYPQSAFTTFEKSAYSNRMNSFITKKKKGDSQYTDSFTDPLRSKGKYQNEIQAKSRHINHQTSEFFAKQSVNIFESNLSNKVRQGEPHQYMKKVQNFPTPQGRSYAKCFKKQKQLDEKDKNKKSQVKVKKPKVGSHKRNQQLKMAKQVKADMPREQIYIIQDLKDNQNHQSPQTYNEQNNKAQIQESFEQNLIIQSQPLKRQLNQQELTKNHYESTFIIGNYPISRNQLANYDVKDNSHIKAKSISGTKSDQQYNLLKLMGGSENLKELSQLVIESKHSGLQIQKQELARFMAANSISLKSSHSFDSSEDISQYSSTFRFSLHNITSFNLADALEESKRGLANFNNFNQISQKTRQNLNNLRKIQPNLNEVEDFNLNEESSLEPSNFVNCKKFGNGNALQMAVIEELESNKIMSTSTSYAQVYPRTVQDYKNHFNPRRALSKVNKKRAISHFKRDNSSNIEKQYQSLSPSKRIQGSIKGVKSRLQKNAKRFKTKMYNC